MPVQPIRIHAATQDQADQVWRALCEQSAITEAEIWLDGSYLWTVVKRDGELMTTLREVPRAHTRLPVTLEAS
jgi:hypothetical protein